MVGTSGALVTMRLVRSKLRKHQESSLSLSSSGETHQQYEFHDVSYMGHGSGSDDNSPAFTRTNGIYDRTNEWVFPPKAPVPNVYNCIRHDDLIDAHDTNGFKGFRKQFSGRFKRLVTKKSESTSAIPPELKPQLKTIYVY